jgi:hypothetical protein
MLRTIAVLLILSGFAGAPRVVRADDDKTPPPGTAEENPLPKILDLMKEAEARLNDADPGEYTQQDQKKIVEAMKFEDKARAALDDLIKKIEHQEGT